MGMDPTNVDLRNHKGSNHVCVKHQIVGLDIGFMHGHGTIIHPATAGIWKRR
jgi:hypothetical protein